MRKITAVLAALALAGCSGKAAIATPISGAPNAPAAASTYHIGQAVQLKTDQSDITVILVKWLPTVESSDPTMDTPAAGNTYAAAELRIVNNSNATWSDSPDNGSKVIGADGQQYDSTMVTGLAGGRSLLAGSVSLVARGQVLGWEVFEVPAAAKVTGVQYTSDSGFGATAQWAIG